MESSILHSAEYILKLAEYESRSKEYSVNNSCNITILLSSHLAVQLQLLNLKQDFTALVLSPSARTAHSALVRLMHIYA